MMLVMAYWEETGEFETIPIATRFADDAQYIADVVMQTFLDYPSYPDYLFTFRNWEKHPVLDNRYVLEKHYQIAVGFRVLR